MERHPVIWSIPETVHSSSITYSDHPHENIDTLGNAHPARFLKVDHILVAGLSTKVSTKG